jgi:hypothetical protein
VRRLFCRAAPTGFGFERRRFTAAAPLRFLHDVGQFVHQELFRVRTPWRVKIGTKSDVVIMGICQRSKGRCRFGSAPVCVYSNAGKVVVEARLGALSRSNI